jgi:hypothetical protein
MPATLTALAAQAQAMGPAVGMPEFEQVWGGWGMSLLGELLQAMGPAVGMPEFEQVGGWVGHVPWGVAAGHGPRSGHARV